MNIGLIDVDGHNYPNLALMKLSAWHKAQGDSVSWYSGIDFYDRVYMSKVFSFTPDDCRVIQADEVLRGGSGYRMYDQQLPYEVEHICPDYSLYPMYGDAYGFITRGCVNRCSFCIVPRKEGDIKKNADITEFIADKKSAILMDNNIIASDWGLGQIEKIASMRIKVDFNQGVDARIIARNPSIAKLLAKVKLTRYLRMAYDSSAITEEINAAIAYLREAGIKPYKMFFYVLAKHNEIVDAEKRVLMLDRIGCKPFVMAYRNIDTNSTPSADQIRFARWCNMDATRKSCKFSEYKY
jgi:hypothetical protein